MSNDGPDLLAAARALLQPRLSFADFLARLPAKDRINAEKRVGVLEASATPTLAEVWRRLACALTTLAPHAAKLVGKQAVQFYVADGGRHRMQVFALEDRQDGNLTIYCPDVFSEAQAAGVVAPQPVGVVVAVGTHGIPGTGQGLQIEALDRESAHPEVHFKDMVGWNRTALRITLPPTASPEQVAAAEVICAIAALRFAPRVAEPG